MSDTEKNSAVDIASINIDIRYIKDWIAEVKGSLTNYPVIVDRQRILDERQLLLESKLTDSLNKIADSIVRVHSRMDDVNKTLSDDSRKLNEELRDFKDKTKDDVNDQVSGAVNNLTKQLNTMNTKLDDLKQDTDSWINKGKGAWKLTSWMLGLAQTIVIAAIGWGWTEINALHDWKIITEERLQNLSSTIPSSNTTSVSTGKK
jgi:hypothetical protein